MVLCLTVPPLECVPFASSVPMAIGAASLIGSTTPIKAALFHAKHRAKRG